MCPVFILVLAPVFLFLFLGEVGRRGGCVGGDIISHTSKRCHHYCKLSTVQCHWANFHTLQSRLIELPAHSPI